MGASPRKDYVGNTSKGTFTLSGAAIAVKANGTIVCATVLENTFSTATITLVATEVGDTVTVNGLVYTAVSGTKANNTEFDIDGNDTADGVDLDDSINNDARTGTNGDISATNSTGVVTVTTNVAGEAGDLITIISSNGTRLAVTGSGFLTGGVDADTVKVNGLTYTAVAGSKGGDNSLFSTDTSDDATATDLADSIDNDTRLGDSGDDVTASSSTDTVTVTAQNTGSGGNTIDLSSTDGTTLVVSGSTLSGGIDGDDVYVNGLKYTAVAGSKSNDTEYSIDTSDNAAATDLADSIDDDVRVGTEPVTFVSTSSGAVVSITGTGTRSHAVALLGSTNVVASGAFLTLGSLASNINDEQETFKRINAMNTPYSVQATGADKDIWKQYAGRIRTVDSTASFNLLTVRTRVLWGNREGYISAHVASTSLVFTWLDKTKTKINTTKTMAEVLASGSMVFLVEDY